MRLWALERRWFKALMRTVLPSGASESFPLGADDIPLEAFLDDFERSAPLKVRIGVRLTLWVIQFAPLFYSGCRGLFSRLAPEKREEVVLRMRKSNLYLVRELPLLFKTIGCMAVLGMPEAQRKLGIEAADAEPPDWARGAAVAAPSGGSPSSGSPSVGAPSSGSPSSGSPSGGSPSGGSPSGGSPSGGSPSSGSPADIAGGAVVAQTGGGA